MPSGHDAKRPPDQETMSPPEGEAMRINYHDTKRPKDQDIPDQDIKRP